MQVAPEIHGVSGLDGANLPEPEIEDVRRHAVEFIEEIVFESGIPITSKDPNVNVALDLDVEKFKKMIFEPIKKFDNA